MTNKKESFDTRFWSTALEFNTSMDTNLTSKANFLFGASTLVLIFLLNKLVTGNFFQAVFINNFPLMILMLGTFLSSLFSLLVILPKIRIFSKKERIKSDVFYYKNILKFYTRKDYCNCIKKLPSDHKGMGEAYANQIYSLASNILPFKFKMLKLSGWILISSLMLSFASYFLLSFFSNL